MNLKGMLVGNPWTDDYYDGGSTIEWIYTHALCSKDAYDAVVRECGALKFSKRTHDRLSNLEFLMSHEPVDPARATQSCNGAMQEVFKQVGSDINQVRCARGVEKVDSYNPRSTTSMLLVFMADLLIATIIRMFTSTSTR